MKLKTDPELIREVQSGDKSSFNEIIQRYEPLISSIVSKFLSDELFTQSDRDDLSQEAAIALYNAAMSYDLSQNEVTFGLYAKICLSNSLNSALRSRRRQVKADLAQLESESKKNGSDPEEWLVDAQLLLEKVEALLSELERSVLRLYIRGYTHRSIAEALGRSEKSIDNAVCRIRMKLADKLL